ncbi:putative ubiquitin-conjugating enzyme E2 23 [Psilocybe cubensis]|uniref:Ubiquitin-conjugating enzyme E2 23 n=1 Tax=Psilocybe cubensis TaxID=181762 RepID=A0ACB8HEZ7_PSICU|nr:putative ubiquitin-conjugating enzyme E2 23 [Psilocybe cubensis]KAH9486595.1 putative ubiquitin-conjugating enzyme E2 23 [Psilocybe cubensis]
MSALPSTKPQAKGSKLFQQDIVAKISDPDYYGIVLRCWHDNEDFPPPPVADPMMRPLSYGEVGVTFISHDREREILPESQLRLVDRTLQPGDYCKRSFDDVRAGVVTEMKVKGKIKHAINAQKIGRSFTTSDLVDKTNAEVGDYVVYDDWVGQVFSQYLVQRPSGAIFQLPEMGSRFAVGESGTNIVSNISEEKDNGGKDIVIALYHSVYVVAWLALNQSLDPSVSASKKRPQRFWFGEDIGKLTLIRGRSDLEMRVGDRVQPKDLTDIPVSEHGPAPKVGQGRLVTTCVVTETLTEVTVLWQNGITEVVKPGDYVLWKNEETIHPAVVQSVNAKERTALVLLPESGAVELVPLLELDAHGTSEHAGNDPHTEVFGVRRGDFVFVHAPGTTNGLQKPRVPRIGEVEAWVREDPFDYAGWRQELCDIGLEIAPKREQTTCGHGSMQRPVKHDGKLLWCGEVTGLNLDGTVQVTHPDSSIQVYPLDRLTKLYDGIEQLEDDVWDEGSDGEHSYTDEEEWAMNEDVEWDNAMDTRVSDDEDDAIQVDEELRSPEHGMPGDDEEISPNVSHNMGPVAEAIFQNPDLSTEGQTADNHIDDISDGIQWKRFEILPSAPSDHHFYSTPPTQVSRAFLSRLSREYRVLRSSLPGKYNQSFYKLFSFIYVFISLDSIVVRAYEDRTDLLRCLIIGPENTPYEDAPFVIDWLLDSNFPQGPPVAHFHSWTNGNGRVNPNLYEEGKVCLSILGTWSGDKDEIWSAARSSLLQTFVSIQGLVLVKEPWFCEPAFDKLRGTEEGTVNSRLYSEKAYVLSRAFVRRALEIPPGGLEPEIRTFYFKEKRLAKVLKDAERLIQKSRASQEVLPAEQDVAVPRLSAGGIISLERTLVKLRSFLLSGI